MFLENLLNDTNAFYLNKDKALIYKKPTPIKILKVSYPCKTSTVIDKAVFENISTLDYNGIYKGRYIEFDAKECKNKTSFPLSNIKTHQITHIKNVIRHGGIIFLIIFINNEFYLLKGESLINYINTEERKSLTIDYI
jgi:recombination protein U